MGRKYLMVSVAVFLSVIFIGSAGAKSPKKEVPLYVANFTYTPAASAAPDSAGVTFAVGKVACLASAKEPKPLFTYPQFDNLDKALKDDLLKLLIAKGFSVRGPFDSYDLMPYSDKKAVDLWLMPSIELSAGAANKVFSLNDIKVEVSGNIILELRELVTKELMWRKTIPFTKFEVPFAWDKITWAAGTNAADVDNKNIMKSVGLVELKSSSVNDAAKGIEKQYPDIMATISKLIDPEEMNAIKKQCQEIKSKK
jgi:hypothetical protein